MRGPLPNLAPMKTLVVLAFIGLAAIVALVGYGVGWLIEHVRFI